MTIGGNRIKKLMDTDRYHQGESIKSKESASTRKQPRNLQIRGRLPKPQTTQDRKDQEYEKGDQSDQEDHESTYEDYLDYEGQVGGDQETEYQDGNHEEPQ